MIATAPEIVRSETAPGTYRNCVSCDRRVHRDQMLDEWECKQCHAEHLDKVQRQKLTMNLVLQKKALGQAVNSMVQSVGAGKFMPNEPHVIYGTILEKLGGVEGFCDIIVKEFKEQRDKVGKEKSGKVIIDFIKMIVVMGAESVKTAPKPPNFDDMTHVELADYILSLADGIMKEDLETKRLEALPPVLLPEPGGQPDVYVTLATGGGQ